jgi:RNA polymerase-associated protein CTR9
LLIYAIRIFCIQALHIQPADKAVIYNIAMIQQKSAELLFSLPAAKRTLQDLERGIARAVHAQKMFGSLAADAASAVPYDRDLAEERKKYADSMLRRAEEHLSAQRQYEAELAARQEGARQKRAAERERVEAIEVRVFFPNPRLLSLWSLKKGFFFFVL